MTRGIITPHRQKCEIRPVGNFLGRASKIVGPARRRPCDLLRRSTHDPTREHCRRRLTERARLRLNADRGCMTLLIAPERQNHSATTHNRALLDRDISRVQRRMIRHGCREPKHGHAVEWLIHPHHPRSAAHHPRQKWRP